MPTYQTPAPISVTIDLSVANLRIAAGDRGDTAVEVSPSNRADDSDVRAAQQVRVDYSDGALRIAGPKSRVFDFSHKSKSVDVTIELPAGSQVAATMQIGDLHSTGRLGDCTLKTSLGNLRVERTGSLRLETSIGNITAAEVAGDAEISTGTGKVELGTISGTATVKNSNGDTEVNEVSGELRVRSANGRISVDHAGAGIEAKTANGGIRVGELVRGSVSLATAKGDLEVGIAEGTAAWLQLNTSFGRMQNLLESAGQPGENDETVEVRGRTSYGDIIIRRAIPRPASSVGGGVGGEVTQ
ncbi:Putative adhesin [Frankineae bacterium MT45]|nr:Putative adhesin [Frankineae bacterium MT45]